MNIQALITLLVLGSSSVALARPVAYPGQEGAPSVRDHRAPASAPAPAYDGSFRSPPFVPPWVTLGTERRMVNGEMAFRVSPSSGRFSTLRLQTTAGKSLIYQVRIQFANGAVQTVALNQYLTAATPTITVDLNGSWARSIKKVTVVGRNARGSSFNVQAF
jgi:hypothetical protein